MRKIVAALCALVAVNANAALILGQTYQDTLGNNWKYIGDYDVGDGPLAVTSPKNYTALEAAALVFGPLTVSSAYAISTADDGVNHMAWYDGFGNGEHLPDYNLFGLGDPLAEDFFVDVGAPGYNAPGDFSAYVGGDRATIGGGALNHVFVSASAGGNGGQPVPEPGSLALVAAGLAGAFAARRKASARRG